MSFSVVDSTKLIAAGDVRKAQILFFYKALDNTELDP
jgi:hypothetical protein